MTALGVIGRFSVAGVALGLLLNASLLLAFDIVAERRGAVYVPAIEPQADRVSR